MNGILLRLLDDTLGSPGRWFWPCFGPLRETLDRHFWIFTNQPWMGAPLEFDGDREIARYPDDAGTSISLWRPGALGRWAERFGEEHVELWAPDPADEDPAALAAAFARTDDRRSGEFIRRHAHLWLVYTDGTCWELFARDPRPLQQVRDHVHGNPSVRSHDSNPYHRAGAFAAAGVGHVWRETRVDRE